MFGAFLIEPCTNKNTIDHIKTDTMTRKIKNLWITIRANPYNKKCLVDLSEHYNKSQSEVVRQLITKAHYKAFEVNEEA